MEFDKTRVYTALNAEDLPVGSNCIFARTIFDLRKEVECDSIIVDTLKKIADDNFIDRFENDNYEWYPLAYLIELPKEPKYRPFASIKRAMDAIKAHGRHVIKTNNMMSAFLVTEDDKDQEESRIFIDSRWYSLQELCRLFVFADDGSPCGELVEETK